MDPRRRMNKQAGEAAMRSERPADRVVLTTAALVCLTAMCCAGCAAKERGDRRTDSVARAPLAVPVTPDPRTQARSTAESAVLSPTPSPPSPTHAWPDVELRYVRRARAGGSELVRLSMPSRAREAVELCHPLCSVKAMATTGSELVYVVQYSDATDLIASRSLSRLVLATGTAHDTDIAAFEMSEPAQSPTGNRLLVVRARDASPAPVPETSIWVIGDDEQQVTEWGFFYNALGWLGEDVVVYSKAAGGTPPCEWTTYRQSLANSEEVGIGSGRAVAIAPGRDRIAVVDDQRCNASQSLHVLGADGTSRLDVGATDSYINAVSWSVDGSHVAADLGGVFNLYDSSTGGLVATYPTAPGFAADSVWVDARLVVFDHRTRGTAPGWLRALDVETGLVEDVEDMAPDTPWTGPIFLHAGWP